MTNQFEYLGLKKYCKKHAVSQVVAIKETKRYQMGIRNSQMINQ
jgi:hypothetical protein